MTLIIGFGLAPLVILTLCFALEVFSGLRPLSEAPVGSIESTRAVIIVPAHDEAIILQERLSALKAAAGDRASILLVADNCSDSTADIGRCLNVQVVTRNDPTRRGKGFALDFARQHLHEQPPDVVLVVDADCTMDSQSIARLIAHCAAIGRPCQAMNIQYPGADSSPTVQLSTFAFFVKNVIRQRGLQRLAGRGQLLGTGMAFPWAIFAAADLATSEIVEDIRLGHDLAERGHGPVFVEQARVSSKAENDRNTLSQRQRWEGGFLRNALRVGPTSLVRSARRGNWRGIWAAINLMIPPLALLIMLDVIGLVAASALTWLAGAEAWPAFVLFGALVIASIAIVLSWRAGGSPFVTVGTLARAPFYILWKIPLYFGLARAGAPNQWLRTAREESAAHTSTAHRNDESARRKLRQ